MLGHPQRRIPSPGSLLNLSVPYLVFLFLAAAFSTGIVEFNAHGQSQTESLSPPQERNIPQDSPAKSAASASAPVGDRLREHYLMLACIT